MTPARGRWPRAERGAISRRTMLRGGAALAGIASLGTLPLFGTAGGRQDPLTCRVEDLSAGQRQLVVSNWPSYIDPIKKATSTLQVFEQRSGIAVDYTDDVSDNSEFFAKVRNQLSACEPIKRDMMMLTDWMAARMIGLGWVQPLDAAKIPNCVDNLIEPLRNRQWDPDLEFHVPWQSGLTGIAYNAKETGEVTSFEELLTRSDLKGRITLLSEMRDTMGFLLLMVGADPDDFDDDQWDTAIDRLREAVGKAQVRAFTGNEYIQDLTAGNIVACEAWSGDVIQAQFDNPDIKFVVPSEGVSLWSDNMLVPNKAQHTGNAEEWMNYYYEPEVAAKLAAWVNFICPVQGAKEAMEKIDPSLVDNKLIFPDDDDLVNSFEFMTLSEGKTRKYEGDWSDVTGG